MSNLEKSEGEFSRWNDQLVTLQEEVTKVERVCEQQIAPDLDTLEKQKREAKVRFEKVTYGFIISCISLS